MPVVCPPEKQPASMRKEAVEAAVKRTSGCCCATDNTLPTAAPRPPAGCRERQQGSLVLRLPCCFGRSSQPQPTACWATAPPRRRAGRRPHSPATISLEAMRSSHPAASLHRVLPQSKGMEAGEARAAGGAGAGAAGRGALSGAGVKDQRWRCRLPKKWGIGEGRLGSKLPPPPTPAGSSNEKSWAVPLAPVYASCRPRDGYISCCPCWQRAAARQRAALKRLC